MDVVVNELSCVCRSISPVEFSVSVFLSFFIVTFVLSAVWPNFLAPSVLFVLKPLTFVSSAVSVIVDAVTMSLIIFPFSVVNISISVNQTSSAVSFVVLPVAFVKRAINPDLNSLPIFSALQIPLAFVLSSIFELLHWLSHSNLCIISRCWVILEWF